MAIIAERKEKARFLKVVDGVQKFHLVDREHPSDILHLSPENAIPGLKKEGTEGWLVESENRKWGWVTDPGWKMGGENASEAG